MNCVLLIALLSLISAWFVPFFIDWWKSRPRVDFGLLRSGSIADMVRISRESVTPITFRFENKTKKRLKDLYFDIQIWRPLSLSNSNRALQLFTGELGRTLVVRRDTEVFHIRHIIELAPNEKRDISIELNSKHNQSDIYPIDITFSSPELESKFKVLKIEIV
ncbi:MAG: hypothetical protein ACKKMW_01905 [Candidatus Nealsonbacteria bacterium]